MSLSDLSQMTDMPLGKKTHRGRRSRGKGNLPPKAQTHHSALNAAVAAGDHGAAKKSALMLANALHASMKPKIPSIAPTSAEPDADDSTPGMGGMGGPPPGMPSGNGLPSRFGM